VRRRTLMSALGATAATPLPTLAQPAAKQVRIGFIEPGTRQANGPFLTSFRAGIAAHGWIEGQNLTILDRWLENRPERLPEIVAGLLAAKPDILVTAGALVTKGVFAAKASLPIVFIGVGDPVGFGFAQSLARPGANVTGLSNIAVDLVSKRLLLLGAGPRLGRQAGFAGASGPERHCRGHRQGNPPIARAR
jgi:putative ABC transport system substrate-binding protein